MKKVKKLNEVIDNHKERNKSFGRHLREEEMKNSWSKVVGEQLSKRCFPMYTRKKSLYLAVVSSTWGQQLNFLKKNIINEVNAFLGGNFIDKLVFKNYNLSKKYNYRNEDEIENKNTNDIKEHEIEKETIPKEDVYWGKKIIEKIDDEELKRKLYKVYILNKKREKYLQRKQGLKKCVLCSTLHDEINDLCFLCNLDKKMQLQNKVIDILRENPTMDYFDLKKIIYNLSEVEYIRINDYYKKREINRAKIFLKEGKIKEGKEKIRKFYYLHSKINNEKLIEDKVRLFIINYYSSMDDKKKKKN